MLLRRGAFVLWIALTWTAGMSAAAADRAGGAAGSALPEIEVATAPVEIDGRVLFRVRGASSLPAEERAANIRARIEAVAADPDLQPTALRAVDADSHVAIMAGERMVMGITDADARLEQVAPKELAFAHLARLRTAIEDYRRARRPEVLLKAGIYALGASLLLAAVVALVIGLARRLDAVIAHRVRSHIRSVGIRSFHLLRAEQIWRALRGALHVVRVLAVVALVLPYLHFVLGLFPWTRGLAFRLMDVAVSPIRTLTVGFIAHIPALLFLLILFVVIRFLLQVIRLFFEAVAQGSVTLSGFEPEWARPTYKIARLAVVALGVIVAYPYIPGSESAAFKGVTLFLGVLFSLGSSSAISNVVAGYSMTYRRAFKVGDRVKIGDVIGDVLEMRLQGTHLRSLKNEEVVVPNSVLLNSQVVNYSSLARTQGLILHTTVGIGYETPWRQVEAMLLLAAERTPGLAPEPSPFVLQKSLGDFAVTYELNVHCHDAQRMMPLYTVLHRSILDVFNEYGVQIMTPAYEGDPDQPKLVPREQWYALPARDPVEDPPRPPAP